MLLVEIGNIIIDLNHVAVMKRSRDGRNLDIMFDFQEGNDVTNKLHMTGDKAGFLWSLYSNLSTYKIPQELLNDHSKDTT